MSTIPCLDCQHIVLVHQGRGRCAHCGAEYEVTISKTKPSPLDAEVLKERQNRHMG